MNLGIFLSPGESFSLMKKVGQDVRFLEVYLERYLKDFENIYVFSYRDEEYDLPKNIILVPNKTGWNRLVYGLFLPILQREYIKDCSVVRGFGLASSLSSFLLAKPFIFNWAYDYYSFVIADKKFAYILFYFLLEKLAFLRADRVLVATKSKINNLKKSKFIYLPNGVDLTLFKSTINKKGLIFIGRLEQQKNLKFLLSAVSLLPKEEREVTFIGKGSLKNELVKLALVSGINLKIIDLIPNNKLSELLRNYSIFLLPSLNEGIPKVLQEAMSMGLVPVVTSFPTAKEVVTNNQDGFITDYDIKNYSDKIRVLTEDDKLWCQMSKKAKRKITEEFDQERLLKKEIEVLKSVS